MTYSLMIRNGDLSVLGSECQVVSGQAKLQQDLTLWLLERYGSDRWHPAFGSNLQSYIGSLISPATKANAYNEIIRVLNNYQAMVYQLFTVNPSLFTISELPYSIDSVNVSITYDTVYATITVSNPATSTTLTISPTSL
jgi:phage baseplate assembly protein W